MAVWLKIRCTDSDMLYSILFARPTPRSTTQNLVEKLVKKIKGYNAIVLSTSWWYI